jgi:hypothetical protein
VNPAHGGRPPPDITVQIWLSEAERAKVTPADVSAAVPELLGRLGVGQGDVKVTAPATPGPAPPGDLYPGRC